MTKERTPTRTAIEKYTDEEGIRIYGLDGWIDCILKSQEPHEASRHKRRLLRELKHKRKK